MVRQRTILLLTNTLNLPENGRAVLPGFPIDSVQQLEGSSGCSSIPLSRGDIGDGSMLAGIAPLANLGRCVEHDYIPPPELHMVMSFRS